MSVATIKRTNMHFAIKLAATVLAATIAAMPAYAQECYTNAEFDLLVLDASYFGIGHMAGVCSKNTSKQTGTALAKELSRFMDTYGAQFAADGQTLLTAIEREHPGVADASRNAFENNVGKGIDGAWKPTELECDNVRDTLEAFTALKNYDVMIRMLEIAQRSRMEPLRATLVCRK
jgi:hypothetical protein